MEDSFTVSDITEAVRLSILSKDRRREKNGEPRDGAYLKLCRLKSPSFYADAQRLIRELERQLSECEAGSREARMLSDQLKTAEDKLGELFRNRMARIVWLAVMEATGESRDRGDRDELANMTQQEGEVYQEVLATIARARRQMLEREQAPPSSDSTSQPEEAPSEPSLPSKRNINEEYVVVRALEAVPTFLGSDGRTYVLGREDVATVPTANARVLIKRGLAVAIHAEEHSSSALEGESR